VSVLKPERRWEKSGIGFENLGRKRIEINFQGTPLNEIMWKIGSTALTFFHTKWLRADKKLALMQIA